MLNNVSRSVARVLPRASIVSSRAAHTDKVFPNLEYYRQKEGFTYADVISYYGLLVQSYHNILGRLESSLTNGFSSLY